MNNQSEFCGVPLSELPQNLRFKALNYNSLAPISQVQLMDDMYQLLLNRSDPLVRYDWSSATTDHKKLYLIGSLRNEAVPTLAASLRRQVPEFEIFDDWYAAGPEADDWWKRYEQGRYGLDAAAYQRGLEGYAANHVFSFDKEHIDSSSHALLVLPAGKSGHMEIMYALYGAGCDAAILLEADTDPRWDVMYKFIPNILKNEEEVVEWLRR